MKSAESEAGSSTSTLKGNLTGIERIATALRDEPFLMELIRSMHGEIIRWEEPEVELTTEQAESLDKALNSEPKKVKARGLPSRDNNQEAGQ